MSTFYGFFISTDTNINGTSYSEGLLNKLVSEQPTVPVVVDYTGTKIGNTTRFSKKENAIFCEFEIDEGSYSLVDYAYIVGLFKELEHHYEGNMPVLDDAKLGVIRLSLIPHYPNQTKVVKKGTKNGSEY